MAKKNTITRAEVLTAVVACDFDTLQRADAREVAAKMLASITKKSDNADKGPSKTALENERLAHELAMAMPESEPVTSAWIMNHIDGIMTVQKAAKIATILCDKGRVVRVPKADGRAMGYQLV